MIPSDGSLVAPPATDRFSLSPTWWAPAARANTCLRERGGLTTRASRVRCHPSVQQTPVLDQLESDPGT